MMAFTNLVVFFSLSVYLTQGVSSNDHNNCNCGQRGVNRIVGGEVAEIGEFPWRVYLRPPACGATIISNSWVLTAAHCINPEVKNYEVHIGDHDKRTGEEVESEWVKVSQVIVHEGYNSSKSEINDIALLQLSEPLVFRHNVGKVCLPIREGRERFTFENQQVVASGWGRTRPSSPFSASSTLRKVNLTVLTNDDCRTRSSFEIFETSICTYNPGKQPCHGDSGSGLDWQDENGSYKIVGVISTGEESCGSTEPSIYARITEFIGWIKEKTGEQFC